MINTVEDVLWVLEHSERLGTELDVPEGSSYVHLSASLCGVMAKIIRKEVCQKETEDRTLSQEKLFQTLHQAFTNLEKALLDVLGG